MGRREQCLIVGVNPSLYGCRMVDFEIDYIDGLCRTFRRPDPCRRRFCLHLILLHSRSLLSLQPCFWSQKVFDRSFRISACPSPPPDHPSATSHCSSHTVPTEPTSCPNVSKSDLLIGPGGLKTAKMAVAVRVFTLSNLISTPSLPNPTSLYPHPHSMIPTPASALSKPRADNAPPEFGLGYRPPPISPPPSTPLPEGIQPMAGSLLLFRAKSLDEAWVRIRDDVYWTEGVWERGKCVVEEFIRHEFCQDGEGS